VIARYAARWSIEVAIEDAKQTFEVGQARNRLRAAVGRTTLFGLIISSLAVCWYATAGHQPDDVDAARQLAPWDGTKTQPSVPDKSHPTEASCEANASSSPVHLTSQRRTQRKDSHREWLSINASRACRSLTRNGSGTYAHSHRRMEQLSPMPWRTTWAAVLRSGPMRRLRGLLG
jgi:hypothetical protein